MLAPSLQQFSLRTEMLPSYIPIRVAEKILFVGESVQMFENHNHSPSRAGREQRREVWAVPAPKVSVFPLSGCDFTGRNRTRVFVAQQFSRQAPPTLLYITTRDVLLISRLHPEAPGGHVRCRAAQTQAAASVQPGGF